MNQIRAVTSPVARASESDLLAAARAGDLVAYGELVRRHQQAAIRVAAMALGSPIGADDVAQDAFIKAHRALGRFRADASFRPWLFRIVVNTARNRHRSALRHRRLVERAGRRIEPLAPGPDEIAAHRDESREIIAAINRLGPADRLILTYRWYEQLTEREIAEALGCRPGTVKSRLSRAMARLRVELGADEEGDPT